MTKARDLANASTALSAVSATELAFVDGVTSAIQTQMDAKASLTGTETLTNKTLTSPVLTTPTISTVNAKGDLLAGTADNTVDRLAVGANDTVLTADSAQATGLKWATPASGGMTLLASGTLSGTSVSLTSIAATYKNLIVYLRNYNNSGGTNDAVLGVNSNTVSVSIEQRNNAGTYQVQSTTVHTIAQNVSNTASNAHAYILIPDYASANVALAQSISYTKSSNTTNSNLFVTSVFPATVAAISSVQLNSASTWGGGTYELWGEK